MIVGTGVPIVGRSVSSPAIFPTSSFARPSAAAQRSLVGGGLQPGHGLPAGLPWPGPGTDGLRTRVRVHDEGPLDRRARRSHRVHPAQRWLAHLGRPLLDTAAALSALPRRVLPSLGT